jgi:hypothetical protein
MDKIYRIAYYFLKLRINNSENAMRYLNNKDYKTSEQVKKFLRYNHQIKFI